MRKPPFVWVALCVLSSYSAAQTSELYPGPRALAGSAQNAIASGDLNGDGFADLLSANADGTLSALLGDGTGNFAPPAIAAAGGPMSDLSLGDFDLDGDLDAAATGSTLSTDLRVLLGNNLGGFSAPTLFTVGTSPEALVLADLNGDGRADAATANSGSSNISVLLGNGTGGFGAAAFFATAGSPKDLAAGTMNAGAVLDLVTANLTGTVSVLLGTGTGTFGAAASFPAGALASSVSLGDLNGDLATDVVVTNLFAVGSGASVLLGNGAGSLGAPAAVATGGVFPADAALGQLGTDGNLDLVVVFLGGGIGALLDGTGGGGFGVPTSFVTAPGATEILLADVDANGRPDVLVANSSLDVSVILAGDSGGFVLPRAFASSTPLAAVATADFNNDGKQDVAGAGGAGGGAVSLLGDGTGALGAPLSLVVGTDPLDVATGDVNLDGNADLATANAGTNNVTIRTGNGAGAFPGTASVGAGTAPQALAFAPLNGDANLDLVVANGGSNNVTIRLGTGGGAFGAATTFAAGSSPSALALGDLNLDGNLDLVVANAGSNDVTLRLGNGSGGFGAASTFAAGTSPLGVAIALLDGNASPDIAVASSGSGECVILFSNGSGGIASTAAFAAGSSPRAVVAFDADGDGDRDLVCAEGGSEAAALLGGNGSGVFAAPVRFSALGAASDVAAANFDGSSPIDLAVASAAQAAVTILRNRLAPPVILTHPTSTAVCAPTAAVFTVAASGATTFQWRKGGSPLANGGNVSGANTATLTLSPTSGSDVGSYDCVVSNSQGSATSNAATLAVTTGVPSISAHPASQSLCAGSGALFSVTASNAVSFQWRKNTIPIGGATASALSIPSVGGADAGSYDCVVTNFCGSATSNAATLTVFPGNPSITLSPAPQTVCAGASAVFAVTATNAAGFQWRKNTVPIGGATASSLSINPVVVGDAGSYDCVVTNPCGSVTSTAATLTVFSGNPSITFHPAPQSVCAGAGAVFAVTATNAASFQWRKNTVPVGGATASSLSINPVVLGDAGSYDCVVTNPCGSVTSTAATLTVFSGNPSITFHPAPQSVCAGAGAVFAVTATNAASFQWRKNTVPIGGATASSLSINPVVVGDAGSYDCVVTNPCGSVTSTAATLTVFSGNPSITFHPAPQSVCAGAGAVFAVTATNAASFQWRKNTVPIGGATASSLSINPVVLGDAGSYDCVVTNPCGSVTSTAATLTVFSGNPSITFHPAPQSVCAGAGAVFAVTATNAASFQWRKNTVPIGGATASSLSINPVVLGDAGSYDCVVTNPCGSVTSTAATLTVFSGNPSITFHPAPQSVCAGAGAVFAVTATNAASFQWRKNTVPIGGATASSLSINPVVVGDAGSYDCVVTNPCGSVTSTAATLTVFSGNPSITFHPAPQSVCAGAGAVFAVTATNAATFQWRKNTVPIGGATASSLSINPVVVGDAGSYDCVVTNPCGSVTSTAATLTVFSGNPAVTTPPANLALCITESALFSVVATDAQTYQWRKDGTPISGADAASYAIPSVVLADAGQYDCVITNPCGSTTSPAATLLVTDVLYVNHAATGSGTGVSWADAITDLETALTKPCTGVQVWVATGTYRPDQGTGNPALSFTLPSGKEVYGGFTGTETLLSQRNPIANPTILSGDIGTLGVDTDNSLHVVDASGADSSGLLDGFTVRAGRAGGGSGGGILISGGSPRIATCTLEDNRGASGAAAFSSTGTPTFDRVTFRSNAATGSGGAFANGSGSPILRRCRFESNSALDGGAVSDSGSAVLASCTFLGNQATGVGGALRIHPGATTQIHGSVLSGNAAGSGGAASNSGSLALTTSTLSSNSATGSGGALRTAGTLTVSNTILWGNSDASGSGQSAQISVASGTVSVNFCDVQGWTGALGGSGNLGVDPQLAEPLGPDGLAGTADDDVRTRPFSPVNDAGSNLLLPLDVADLDGDSITAEPIPLDVADRARRVDAVTVADSGAGSAPFVDIGAHEFCDCEPLPYGTGTPGCNGPQTMRAFGSPTIGNAGFQLRSDRSPASTLGLGMATTFPDVAGSDPFTIGALLHVDLFFSPEIYTLDFFSDPAGLGIAPVPLPNVPALIGSVYHAQTLWAWGTCSLPPFGISTSGGLRFKILGP